jgi:ketosteroid isomerase-like protein
LARRFFEAFNARDGDAIRDLVADDVEFRSPRGGAALQGEDGIRALLAAATDMNLRLQSKESPKLANDGRVAVPLDVAVGRDEVHGTAFFEVRDGRIAAFEALTEVMDR